MKRRSGSLLLWCIVTPICLVLSSCLSPPSGPGQEVPVPRNDPTVFDVIPAARLAEVLSPGWNLGNQLEGVTIKTDAATGISVTWPSETAYMATRISEELMVAVKAAGFRFVRIPVSFFAHIDDRNGYRIDPAWMARIKEVVDWCVKHDLSAMINIHGDGYYSIRNSWLRVADADQGPVMAKYIAVWKQLAEAFKDYDESLLFESMNEVFDGNYTDPSAIHYENLNLLNEAFVRTVRETGGNNARRWLVVPGWNTNIDYSVRDFGKKGSFRLPKDRNLVVSVHYYDPWGFCGGENGTATQWGSFSSRPEKTNGTEVSMATQFNKLEATFISQGIPVIVGEWGSIDKVEDDPENPVYRAYYAQKLSENARRIGAVPVIWDNGWNGKYGFALFHRGDKADEEGNIIPGTVRVTQQGIIDAIMGVYAPPSAEYPRARITVDRKDLSLEIGERGLVKARVSGVPAARQNSIASWRAWDETVAVVNDGQVVPMGPGSTTLEARLPNGHLAFVNLTVKELQGVVAKVYIFEGLGWSSVKSEPVVIRAGSEQAVTLSFKASELVLRNIAAMYLKDVEVEENHAPSSPLTSAVVTVESIEVNGTALPLVRNREQEAINPKNQFDLPFINQWATDREMLDGLPAAGNRDMQTILKGGPLLKEDNVVTVRLRVSATATERQGNETATAAKPTLDPASTYKAYLGIQASDSWVFRNSYGNGSFGGGSAEFEAGLHDTENSLGGSGPVPGTITDATLTKADVEAGKTISVRLDNFTLDDSKVKASALNMAMISTDIPYGALEITGAKLYFDDKQVNLDSNGQDVFVVGLDKSYLMITFINIWDSSIKTFGYSMPVKSVRMEFTAKLP